MKIRVLRHEVVQPLDQSIKLVPLTQGQNAIVDAADFEFLMQWNWHAIFNKRDGFYAGRSASRENPQSILMHRFLTGNAGIYTDHKNGNGLDNRKDNLRPCQPFQNAGNRDKSASNKSGYKGVHFNKGLWCAQIRVNTRRSEASECSSRTIYLGSFACREEAARAYDRAALIYFQEFARLNFPL